jgi:hypothetical protein
MAGVLGDLALTNSSLLLEFLSFGIHDRGPALMMLAVMYGMMPTKIGREAAEGAAENRLAGRSSARRRLVRNPAPQCLTANWSTPGARMATPSRYRPTITDREQDFLFRRSATLNTFLMFASMGAPPAQTTDDQTDSDSGHQVFALVRDPVLTIQSVSGW